MSRFFEDCDLQNIIDRLVTNRGAMYWLKLTPEVLERINDSIPTGVRRFAFNRNLGEFTENATLAARIREFTGRTSVFNPNIGAYIPLKVIGSRTNTSDVMLPSPVHVVQIITAINDMLNTAVFYDYVKTKDTNTRELSETGGLPTQRIATQN